MNLSREYVRELIEFEGLRSQAEVEFKQKDSNLFMSTIYASTRMKMMASARGYFATATVAGGGVLAAGGQATGSTGGVILNAAEIYW